MALLLSYHDACLYEADLQRFTDDQWLNDNCINLFFAYVRYHALLVRREVPAAGALRADQCLFVDPSVVACLVIQCDEDDEIQELGEGLNLVCKELIFIPVNDSTNFDTSSSHWSLMVYRKSDNSFSHYDSVASSNLVSANKTANKFRKLLSLSKALDIKAKKKPVEEIKKAPQQKNGHDCGMIMCMVAEHLALEACGMASFKRLADAVTPKKVSEQRKKMVEIVSMLKNGGTDKGGAGAEDAAKAKEESERAEKAKAKAAKARKPREMHRTQLCIYHETQQLKRCGQHCVNNLLQGPFVSLEDLNAVSVAMDRELAEIMGEPKKFAEGEDEFIKQFKRKYDQSVNCDPDNGNWSLAVVQVALRWFGLNCMSSDSPEASHRMRNPEQTTGFICLANAHWWTIRRFGRFWFDLDSKKPVVALIPDLRSYLRNVKCSRGDNGTFVVLGEVPRMDGWRRCEELGGPSGAKSLVRNEYSKNGYSKWEWKWHRAKSLLSKPEFFEWETVQKSLLKPVKSEEELAQIAEKKALKEAELAKAEYEAKKAAEPYEGRFEAFTFDDPSGSLPEEVAIKIQPGKVSILSRKCIYPPLMGPWVWHADTSSDGPSSSKKPSALIGSFSFDKPSPDSVSASGSEDMDLFKLQVEGEGPFVFECDDAEALAVGLTRSKAQADAKKSGTDACVAAAAEAVAAANAAMQEEEDGEEEELGELAFVSLTGGVMQGASAADATELMEKQKKGVVRKVQDGVGDGAEAFINWRVCALEGEVTLGRRATGKTGTVVSKVSGKVGKSKSKSKYRYGVLFDDGSVGVVQLTPKDRKLPVVAPPAASSDASSDANRDANRDAAGVEENRDAVQKLTDQHLLLVFSDSTCPFCKQVIQALGDADLQVQVQDINGYKNLLRDKTGHSSVPSVWVGNKFVGGCNDGPESWMGAIPNLKKGKLQRWVKNLAKSRGSAGAPGRKSIFAIMRGGLRKGKGKGKAGSGPDDVLESAEWLLLRPAANVLDDMRVAY
jgi:glutaredoxin